MLWSDRKRLWCGLPWTFTKYSYDEERLYIESGFLNQRQDEVRLYRIMDISLTRSLTQRIFGLSTIHLSSSDKSLGNFDLKNIKNGVAVKDQLSDLIEGQRDRKRVVSREFMTTELDEDEADED